MKKGRDAILIMCGGRGRRLGTMTKKLPKPLIEIGGMAILELKLRNYKRQGFKDFIICLGYKGDQIKEAVRRFDLPVKCRFSDAGEPAGILKRLYAAKGLFGERVILTYGDTFSDIDLTGLSAAHIRDCNEATIVAAPIQNPFGLIEFNKNNKIISFREKPVLNYYIGYAVINKSALGLIPSNIIDMPDGEGLIAFYKALIEAGKLGVYYHAGRQITFNTEDELKLARKKILSFYTIKEET